MGNTKTKLAKSLVVQKDRKCQIGLEKIKHLLGLYLKKKYLINYCYQIPKIIDWR